MAESTVNEEWEDLTKCPQCGRLVPSSDIVVYSTWRDHYGELNRSKPLQCKECYVPEKAIREEEQRLKEKEEVDQRRRRHQDLLQEILQREQASSD